MTSPLVTHPAVFGERVVFVSEDDLWTAPLDGGLARRLTSGTGRMQTPRFSRDGGLLAVSALEEGARDVYVMDAEGGPLERRTWMGGNIEICGFDPDGSIVFSTSVEEPFVKADVLYRTAPTGDANPERLGLGPAVAIDWAADGRRVLGRNTRDLAPWQRYRGGRRGQIWVETAAGSGEFTQLPDFGGNPGMPMWIGGRIWFVCDHTGHGNVHSCLPDGSGLEQHTRHEGFPTRFASHDSHTLVYVVAGDLWRLDLASGEARKVEIQTRSQRTRTQLRFPSAKSTLQSYAIHPQGHSLALTMRGKPFVGGFWEGPFVQLGEAQGVHYRLAKYLADGERMVWSCDAGGEDHIEVLDRSGSAPRALAVDVGRPTDIVPGPDDVVAVMNHRSELHLVNVVTGESTLVERNPDGPVAHASWSADGRWLAWSSGLASWGRTKIRLAHVHELEVKSITDVTDGRFRDRGPDFDPLGRYLFFLSDREFEAVHDGVRFDYGFPYGSRPYLVTLQADATSPFRPAPRDLAKPKPPKAPEKVQVDLDGIADRIVRFPISDGRYLAIRGLPSGRVLLSRDPIIPAAGLAWNKGGPPDARSSLFLWDFEAYSLELVHGAITGFTLDHPRKTCAVRVGDDLRVFPADADKTLRTELKKTQPRVASRKERWIDLSRARLAVDPSAEWAQMLDESWRLMREHFWDAGMSGVDWAAVRERYRPLVARVSSRSELSDLVWAMIGELGTSHAYEMGGEYRATAIRSVARLGADVRWNGEAWEVTAIHPGDIGHPTRSAPLLAPGVNTRVGTRIHAVNGVPVAEFPPLGALLMGHSNRSILLDLSEPGGDVRRVEVRPLGSDTTARYRTWVEANRARVREATQGRAGYVHIPDMGPAGFADFHRDFFAECELDALVVDVRFNRGGHVSQHLLGTLMQRRLAYSQSRWFRTTPYPRYAVLGPMVALTNEYAGSDGDIFSYHWKQLGLGPLVGTRTWGGVVGIAPRAKLVDGTIVTQPEFANWMQGAGFGVENYGVDPDVEVVIAPQDHAAGRDPQMDRALALLLERLDAEQPAVPDLGPAPTTTPPKKRTKKRS
ncbi:MAG: PDZ domain-containing protein [Alphaproteobacteria bacterium]|nr:PDZ domain-containing protein [Alphaproteobacteria bacterium]